MVAIKNMEMPTDCKKCTLMGTDGDPRDYLNPMMCIAIWAITHEIKHCVGGEIRDDCPLVEIEERKVGKWIYHKKSKSTCFKEYRECSCCHCYFKWEMPRNSYCPNCGAEMVGAENDC